ncbi:hypothetical protein VII00023_19489 [Vibrio ichthyoenteri ATCC 700023]|uniref:Uncharacterized protein n=1 Tax=Vibrio ichthyoenteri ATCC 700023 TaxID=870968 RepID=F9S3C8_9VIBR|nr:hypothetical protein [Vibrio ichthyoenteri]EGU38152.1 hypothetical protein VII00023_19489 [Vibrio ichthyoenteri ATCC 700023]
MPYKTKKHRFHAFWARLLIALVVISCLNKTVFTAHSWLTNSDVAFTAQSVLTDSALKNLYSSHFDRDLSSQVDADNSDSCSYTPPHLPQIQSKTDWIVPFMALFLVAFVYRHLLCLYARNLATPLFKPKQRIHLTQCVFQE